MRAATRRNLRRAGLALAVPMAVFLLTEATARLRWPRADEPLGRGVAYRHLTRDRFREYVEIVSRPRPRDELRVLVTGGSAAAGHGSSGPGATMPAGLERILNEGRSGRRVRVFNAGVLGMDSPGELLFYLRFLHKLEPDVVVMYSGFNDLWDAVKYQTSHTPYDHVFALDRHQYVPVEAAGGHFRTFLLSSALVLHRGLTRVSRLYELAGDWLRRMDELPMRNLTDFRYDDAVRDVKPFLDVVRSFQALGREEGFEFFLVMQPMRPLTNLPPSEAPISRWEHKVRLLYRGFLRPGLRAAAGKGLKVLDLNESFIDEVMREDMLLPLDFCHLDDRGYLRAAEEVAAFLRRDSRALNSGTRP